MNFYENVINCMTTQQAKSALHEIHAMLTKESDMYSQVLNSDARFTLMPTNPTSKAMHYQDLYGKLNAMWTKVERQRAAVNRIIEHNILPE